jgi:hypothetical protein
MEEEKQMEKGKDQEDPYKDYILLSRQDFCSEEVWYRVWEDLGIIKDERTVPEDTIYIIVKESGRVY